MNLPTLLIVTFDYRPQLGGVATCTYELAKALNKHFKVIVIAPEHIHAKNFDEKQDFVTHRLPLPSSSGASILPAAKSIYHLIKEYPPIGILCTTWSPSAISTYLASRFSKTPYFVLTHGVEVLESSRNWKKKLRSKMSFIKKSVYQKAHHHFAVSQYTAGLVQNECLVDSQNITITHNGIDIELWSPQKKPQDLIREHQLENKKVLLTISRLVPHKGIDITLEAIHLLKKEFPQLVYLIGGDGPDRSRLQRKVQDLKLENHVLFLGPISFEQIQNYYHLCDVYIMLSRFEPQLPAVEGFGIAFLEAGACEKPVIAGRSGGTSDAVIENETGYLVSPTNPKEAADKIKKLFKHEELAKEMGKKSRERISQIMNWQNTAQKMAQKILECTK